MPKRHLSSGLEVRQEKFLKTLARLTIVADTFYSALNFYEGIVFLAILNIVMLLISVGVLFCLRIKKHVKPAKWLFALSQAVVILVSLIEVPEPLVFIWALLALPIAHRLLGLRAGSVVSVIFLSLSAALFIWRFSIESTFASLRPLTEVVPFGVVLFLTSYAYERDLQKIEKPLRERADVDPLTRLATRARFHEIFQQKCDEMLAGKSKNLLSVSMILVDLDNFKSVNDTYGHAAGDEVLRAVSHRLISRCRPSDLLGRLGGEELAIVLFGVAHADAAGQAERLRACVAEYPIRIERGRIEMTVSIGVATVEQPGNDFDRLFAKADRRLYAAKKGGRNRVYSTPVEDE